MGSVVYRSSGGSNYQHSRNTNRSSNWTWKGLSRGIAGLCGIGCSIFFTYAAFQFISLILAGLGTVGAIAAVAISGGCLLFGLVQLFKFISGHGINLVTLFTVACIVAASFIPALPAFLGLICVILGAMTAFYQGALALVRSRAFALSIAAIPLVGSVFFVPAQIGRAGLVTNFGSASSTASHGSPIAGDLTRIQDAVSKTYKQSAIVSYQVRENRLYADIARNGAVESLDVNSDDLVRTPIPWLQWSLPRRLNSLMSKLEAQSESSREQLAGFVAPVAESVRELDAVVVADGVLLNQAQQPLMDKSRNVFRSVSLDAEKIGENVAEWAKDIHLRAEDIAVVNALPESSDDLEHMGIPGAEWPAWRTFHEDFLKAVPKTVSTAERATKAASLDGLKTKKAVLFVVAHSDGFSIRLPNGENLDVKDLDEISNELRENQPRVFLFSCQTARITDMQSFAKVLLDHGAKAVVAPTTLLQAESALSLFKAFFEFSLGPKSVPLGEAYRRAMEASGERSMEIWISRLHPSNRFIEVQREVPDVMGSDFNESKNDRENRFSELLVAASVWALES